MMLGKVIFLSLFSSFLNILAGFVSMGSNLRKTMQDLATKSADRGRYSFPRS